MLLIGPEPIDDAPPLFGEAPDAPPAIPERALEADEWEAVLSEARKQAPIKVGLVGNTLFVSDEDGLVTIAIHPEDISSRDALLSSDVAGILSDCAAKICGRGIRLRVVIDDSVAAPAPPPPPPPLPTPEPLKRKAPEAAAKLPEPDQPPSASLRPTEEEFYNDPLIEMALKEFHARIIK